MVTVAKILDTRLRSSDGFHAYASYVSADDPPSSPYVCIPMYVIVTAIDNNPQQTSVNILIISMSFITWKLKHNFNQTALFFISLYDVFLCVLW